MNEEAADRQLAAARQRAAPAVAEPPNRWMMPIGVAVVGLLGLGTFAALRANAPGPATLVNSPPQPAAAPLPPPPTLQPAPPAFAAPPPPPPPPAEIAPAQAPPRRVSTLPALIVDTAAGPALPAADAAKPAIAADRLSPNEAFADRLSRAAPESVGTDKLTSTDLVVPQGTIIAAVLETAINSDLPGLVRAVVSRDVPGFDGTKILIPRGSRLVGQYSSGVAVNQSRAFVIWTRVLRSDGVSVQLGSSATDPLGSAGLGGKVDSHFVKRFGAATLLSVITGAIDVLANTARGGASVQIGNSTQANQLASIALQRQIDISPTIKVAQGTPVRVFVARDLDFGVTRDGMREKRP